MASALGLREAAFQCGQRNNLKTINVDGEHFIRFRGKSCVFKFIRLSVDVASVSLMEISRNPGNYLPMMLLFIHRRYVLNYQIFYDLCALSPQSLSSKSVFISY